MKRIAFITAVALAGISSVTHAFELSSPTVKPNSTLTLDQVYKGFGCEGKNISPALVWKNPPKGTKSFAVTVYDPDAPTGSGWWHWLIFNIPATATGLEADAGNVAAKKAPAGSVQSRTDFGAPGFGGACPPPGSKAKPHRYIFTVYALKTDKIDVPAEASGAMVGFNLQANKLGSATFTARYGR